LTSSGDGTNLLPFSNFVLALTLFHFTANSATLLGRKFYIAKLEIDVWSNVTYVDMVFLCIFFWSYGVYGGDLPKTREGYIRKKCVRFLYAMRKIYIYMYMHVCMNIGV
jgi:hypothetical protein